MKWSHASGVGAISLSSESDTRSEKPSSVSPAELPLRNHSSQSLSLLSSEVLCSAEAEDELEHHVEVSTLPIRGFAVGLRTELDDDDEGISKRVLQANLADLVIPPKQDTWSWNLKLSRPRYRTQARYLVLHFPYMDVYAWKSVHGYQRWAGIIRKNWLSD